MKIPKLWLRAAVVQAMLLTSLSAVNAEEPLLPPISKQTFDGEWQGAWGDRGGRLSVALLRVRSEGKSTLTIASGVVAPFVTVFEITRSRFSDGRVDIDAVGTGDEVLHRITLSGEGWALAETGLLNLSLEKSTKSGVKLGSYQMTLYKMSRGFIESAAKLLRQSRAAKGTGGR